MDNKKSIRAAAAQWDIRLGDTSHNLGKAESFLSKFADSGVNLAVFPEMWSCGFDYRDLRAHAGATPGILDRLAGISQKTGITICGSLPQEEDEKIFNSLFVVGSKGDVCSYRKIHLFTPTGEDKHFAPGGNAVVCNTDVGGIGLVICYDLRFPELSRALALEGAEIIICCAQWPGVRINHWNTLLSARAIENQVFVVAANRIGQDFSIVYGGSSRIISPFGNVLAECGSGEEYAVCDLDFKELSDFRSMMPCLEHIRNGAYKI